MRTSFICPFFGLDKNQCSRGFGYVSPEEGKEIVDSCINNYKSCSRYEELGRSTELASSVQEIDSQFGRMLSPYSLLNHSQNKRRKHTMNSQKNGWAVVFAGMGLNLALGVLYAWSVFGKQLTDAVDKGGFGWTKTQAAMPYTIAIACFAFMMVPAGRLQDKLGPRIVATLGAILTGMGLFVAGFSSPENIMPALLGFGVLAGTGFGLGYAAATPAAVKWFPAEKKGLITGLVVAGFGLAPVYIAPLSKYLLGSSGISASFKVLGVAFTVVTVLLCQLIKNPPVVLKPAASAVSQKTDYTWKEMIATPTFALLWMQYACAATAGLMIIGHLAKIVAVQSSNTIQIGFLFVALLAIFNAAGRIIAGVLSDKIGRIKTITIVCISQALIMFMFGKFYTITAFIVGSSIVGFSYGACLSLFPSTTADFWGTKNLGLNYGIMFTAWGVGGVFGPLLAGRIADANGNYTAAYMIASGLLLFAAVLTIFTKAPKIAEQEEASIAETFTVEFGDGLRAFLVKKPATEDMSVNNGDAADVTVAS